MLGMNVPETIVITEVCPRDGFQNHKTPIPTDVKKEIIDDLCGLGFPRMEITSFVSPRAIPQMHDAPEIMRYFNEKWKGVVRGIALVPNIKGAENALEAGAKSLIFALSASEKHNMANTRRTVEGSLAELREICGLQGYEEIGIGIATSFTCPFAGDVPAEDVVRIIGASLDFGVAHITVADTMGTASPLQVEKTLTRIKKEFPGIDFALHFHDTYGFGLANVLTALRMGCDSFETSAASMGGCPFAPGATGNLATEDLVNMAEKMGIGTGIDLARLLTVSRGISEKLELKLSSHAVGACRNF